MNEKQICDILNLTKDEMQKLIEDKKSNMV